MAYTRRRRTRTPKVRTALSRPCPAGQTDNRQRFFENSGQKIRTENRYKKSRQNPDSRQITDTIFRKIRTKTGHGQDTDNTVRRRLAYTWSNGHCLIHNPDQKLHFGFDHKGSAQRVIFEQMFSIKLFLLN